MASKPPAWVKMPVGGQRGKGMSRKDGNGGGGAFEFQGNGFLFLEGTGQGATGCNPVPLSFWKTKKQVGKPVSLFLDLEAGDGQGGDAFAAADEAEFLVGGGFDADLSGGDA